MADAPDHRLSIRNIWHGAVGWLIEGAERRVMVRCVSAWTVTGVTKGLTWLSADAVLLEELRLPRPVPKLGPLEIADKSAA